MPISNPIITIVAAPPVAELDWANITNKPEIFPTDWENVADKPVIFPTDWENVANKPEITADAEPILNKILVADGQVLTTEDSVIFED